MRMKHLVILIIFSLFSVSAFAQQQQPQPRKQTQSQLAIAYYNAKDFEKAIPLLLEAYKTSRNRYYYQLYLNCYILTDRFEEAEAKVREEMAKQRPVDPQFMVYLGYLLEKQDKMDEAEIHYNQAIDNVPVNKGGFLSVASSFLRFAKYDYAEKVYLKGRKLIPPEKFNNELARVYLSMRNYDRMMDEYLDLLRINPKQLARVQSSLSSAMRLDIDGELREKFRKAVLIRIQSNPNFNAYNRLLIWFFLQEKKFSSALRQAVALDKRTNEEDVQIYQLGLMALKNKEFGNATDAFDYVIGKGNNRQYFVQSFLKNIEASYQKFVQEFPDNEEPAENLEQKFSNGLEMIGMNFQSLPTIIDYAHFLAFYQNKIDKAREVLLEAQKMPNLKPQQIGTIKTELADIYVYYNDPWEATLIYSQVIDANKKNNLGDEVKLKKAKLGYYLGNFSWAKAQLDVLKASTSKLTANDAMELSMLIGNNLNLDTTAVPLQMFARADLLFFRNKDSLALATLDSIAEIYPYHTLVDDILNRKAKIAMEQNEYEKAAEYYKRIHEEFRWELLADDALFQLAEIYNFHLNQKEKAKDLYRQMLSDFPGSVFVDESRQKYRELREIYPDSEEESKENLFMRAIEQNEFE